MCAYTLQEDGFGENGNWWLGGVPKWQMGANTLAQGNLIYNKRLGKYGPIKAFMVRYLHYRMGITKDSDLTMDRRGGLEHTSVAQTRIHTAFHV